MELTHASQFPSANIVLPFSVTERVEISDSIDNQLGGITFFQNALVAIFTAALKVFGAAKLTKGQVLQAFHKALLVTENDLLSDSTT